MRIDDDKKFMARALELAANGMGFLLILFMGLL